MYLAAVRVTAHHKSDQILASFDHNSHFSVVTGDSRKNTRTNL